MHRSTRRTQRDEQGASLVLVLLIMTVGSLIVGAVLSSSSTAQLSMQTTKQLDSALATAERGVERVLQNIKSTGSCGPLDGTGHVAVPAAVSEDAGAKIRCSGAVTAVTGTPMTHAVVLLDDRVGKNLYLQSGSCVKAFQGDLYLAAAPQASSAKDLEVNASGQATTCGGNARPGGFVYQRQATGTTCAAPRTWIKVDQSDTVSHYTCGQAAAPDPDLPLPTKPAAAPSPVDVGLCRVFKPGTYTSTPALSTHNYFVSGLYVFDAADASPILIDASGRSIYGGQPNTDAGDDPTELPATTLTDPCRSMTDVLAGVSTDAKGVQLVLSGPAAISVENASNTALAVQLNSYQPATGQQHASRVSIRAVRATASGYRAWKPVSLPTGCRPQGFTGGVDAEAAAVCVVNAPYFRVGGLVHVPTASVALTGGNDDVVAITGGLVAYDLALQSQPPVGTFSVELRRRTPTTGTSTITSGVAVGGRCITVVAVVDAAQAGKVTSWRVLGDGPAAGGFTAPDCAG